MAYIDQTQDTCRRVTAIAGIAVVHSALAVALLSMGVVGTKVIPPAWDPFVITPDPTPTPSPPSAPDQPTRAQLDPPIAAQLPEIERPLNPFDRPFDDGQTLDASLGSGVVPLPTPAPTPQPSPSITPKGSVPAGQPASWIRADDYPARPLRDGIEGVASYRVIVSSSGEVSSCEITRSTGNRALDETTCRLISRRARFKAATDESGVSVVGSYSGSVRWEIPD